MEILYNIWNTQECQLIFKMILIFILSGFIGLERASLSKPAGFRTHVLVGISAVLVMEAGIYLYGKMDVDPTRIAAQLLSGIGFLGAGTILRDGFSVKGLTTAASLLAVTCIGLIIGTGFYLGGIVATIIVYFVLTYSKFFNVKIDSMEELNIIIETDNPKDNLEEIQNKLDENFINIIKLKIIKEDEKEYIKIGGQFRYNANKNKLFTMLMEIDDVKNVSDC